MSSILFAILFLERLMSIRECMQEVGKVMLPDKSRLFEDNRPDKSSPMSSILLAILFLERLMSSNRRDLSGSITFPTSCMHFLTNSSSAKGLAERAIFSAITYDAITDFSFCAKNLVNVFCFAERELFNFVTKFSLAFQ